MDDIIQKLIEFDRQCVEKVELAKKKSDIDFDTFSLDANNRLYQQNASSLESMQSFAKMFVWIVVIAGSTILCLILALTIRNRYYEIGVLLSLGQSKVKIIAQQLIEIGFFFKCHANGSKR